MDGKTAAIIVVLGLDVIVGYRWCHAITKPEYIQNSFHAAHTDCETMIFLPGKEYVLPNGVRLYAAKGAVLRDGVAAPKVAVEISDTLYVVTPSSHGLQVERTSCAPVDDIGFSP